MAEPAQKQQPSPAVLIALGKVKEKMSGDEDAKLSDMGQDVMDALTAKDAKKLGRILRDLVRAGSNRG